MKQPGNPAVFRFAGIAGIVLLSSPVFGSVTDLSTVIGAAEKANHFLSAAQNQETVAESQIAVARSGYLPHLEADAFTTSGFSGSSSLLGISGITGASHSGYATALMASTTLWDFGRTLNQVRQAAHQSAAQKAQAELTREDVDFQAAQLFYDCARTQSQARAWSSVLAEAQLVSKEVERFVRTGQRSIVDRYLSRAQLEESLTNQKDYEERTTLGEQRLQALTRLPLDQLQCPELGSTLEAQPAPVAKTNPLLVRASENAAAADAQVNYANDDFMPRLKAFAGIGKIENLANKDDYAVGIGVQIPLFDGLRTVNQLRAAEANRQAQEDLVGAAQDTIDLANSKYNQVISAANIRLVHLKDELVLADEGFKVAKSRYFSLQGNLVDLREALRNLMRTRSQTIDTQAEYMLALEQQKIFNEEMRTK